MKLKQDTDFDFTGIGQQYAQELLKRPDLHPATLSDLAFDPDYRALDESSKEAIRRAVREVARAILTMHGYPVQSVLDNPQEK